MWRFLIALGLALAAPVAHAQRSAVPVTCAWGPPELRGAVDACVHAFLGEGHPPINRRMIDRMIIRTHFPRMSEDDIARLLRAWALHDRGRARINDRDSEGAEADFARARAESPHIDALIERVSRRR